MKENIEEGITIGPEDYVIPLKINPECDIKKVIKILLNTTEYLCPKCKRNLVLEKQYKDGAVFYCPYCKEHVKAKMREVQ